MPSVTLFPLYLLVGLSSQSLVTFRESLEDTLSMGHSSLNEMFREVEMLMEDTQHILEEAVDQMATESAKSFLIDLDNAVTSSNQTTDIKEADNRTEEASSMETLGRWNDVGYECMVDEDCGDLGFCMYDVQTSKCFPCRAVDMTCVKDNECCGSNMMCIYGQCTVNATLGDAGSICQFQSDCRPKHCCAFQRELLFPVCTPRPVRKEPCFNHPNLLMDMLAWDQDGPRDHCPCVSGLQCQQHGRWSICEK